MAEPLKHHYNDLYFERLCHSFELVVPDFSSQHFMAKVCGAQWPAMELKQRMRHITGCLHQVLEGDYLEQLAVLKRVAPLTSKNSPHSGFLDLFFPDFVECYGQKHWGQSLDALELFTQYSSAEFAVRPFIKQRPDDMMQRMLKWAEHPNHHVRRLASEGCRPRLPWAGVIVEFKRDPSKIIPILEILKEDSSLYVRKSVANNLNDISKDNPSLILNIAKAWHGNHHHTDWIVKHGCRTLLKQGNQQALTIFGLHDTGNVELNWAKLVSDHIAIGQSATIEFELMIKKAGNLRLEYAIDYVKARGKTSRKIFKISERQVAKGALNISRVHHFKNLSTRKHFVGKHDITLLANGRPLKTLSLTLFDSHQ